MCRYTNFLFVISIKYDFKYLLSLFIHSILTQEQDNLTLQINCGLGVPAHIFNIKLYKNNYDIISTYILTSIIMKIK
jgi:hypothetical protein